MQLFVIAHRIKIRHTQNAKERLEEAHKVMDISNRLSGYLETAFNPMAMVRITDKKIKELIQHKLFEMNISSG